MENESPIACRLTTPELAARLEEIRAGLLSRVESVERTDAGYRLRLSNTDEIAASVLDFVRYERQCCPFLDFQVTIPAQPRPIDLDLGGNSDVMAFIHTAFIANVPTGKHPL